MRAQKPKMVIRMTQTNNNSMFISRAGGVTYLCSLNGQKLIIDQNTAQKSDEEILNYYKSMNVFQTNERRC